MPLFSNTEQVSARYAEPIAAFRKLFAFHSLRCGSPGDFAQLAPKLTSSEGFRLDFSDRVRTVRDRERGRLSAVEMLTILGIAIGGEGIAAAEMEVYPSASTVQVMLAGVGGWRETGGECLTIDTATEGAGENEFGPHTEAPADGGERRNAMRAKTRDRASDAWESGRRSAGYAERGAGGEVSPEMKETLARLEMASLQLKVYLDDIDRRMGRIEPHLDDLTAMVQTSTEQFRRLGQEAPRMDVGSVPDAVARPKLRRADQAIAAAMEMASHDRRTADQADQADLSNRIAEADERAVAHGEMVFEGSAGEEHVQEPRGRPMGWERRSEAAGEAPPTEVDEIAGSIDPEAEIGVASLPAGVAVEAKSAPVSAEMKAVPRRLSERGRTRRDAWAWGGAAAAAFLLAAGSLGYVYQPWRLLARDPPAEHAATDRQQTAETTIAAKDAAVAGGASTSAMTPRSVRPAAARSNVSSIAGQGRDGRGAGGSPAVQTAATQTAVAGGRDRSAGGPAAAGLTTLPPAVGAGTPAVTEVAGRNGTGADAPKNRVEAARAADVPKVLRVENLHPEEAANQPTAAGGPSPRLETAAMVSGARPPVGGGAAAPGGVGSGDVPRASAGKTDIAPSSIGVTVVSAPSPTYPQQARQMGVEGKVLVQATVDKSGTVTSARVVDGPFLLRQSAQDAVLRRRYKPYLLHGEPAEFQTMVTLSYKLAK